VIGATKGQPGSAESLAGAAIPRLLPIGVLISGKGTNLDAILSRCADGSLQAEPRAVVSNRATADGLAFSREKGIPTFAFSRNDYVDRHAQQIAMADWLEQHGVELVVLAGFDQILVPEFVARFPGRMINLHPSLLPAFPGGMHAVRDALAAGVKITGCTVHFVTDDLDGGPIILQEAVPVAEDDDEASLLARIHEAEHRILPAAIQLLAEGRIRIEDRKVRIL
jgi:phosphoribosylglycinamide formyltransferase 1